MFKRLDPRDINITPFKAYKEFTVTNVDSGSGVYGFRAISSSAYNFDPDTATKTTFDSASFYHIPTWFMINQMYYRDTQNNYNNFGQNNGKQYRLLQPSASIISVSKDLYGERINPTSVTLTDDSGASTLTIKDDGKGFPSEILERIGSPYISNKNNENSMGLGIFIAKNLIENIGGNIKFYNEFDNHKTIVEISLKRNI